MNTRYIAGLLLCFLMFAACSKHEDPEDESREDHSKTYYSIKQFAADQVKSHMGSPFVITKLVNINGVHDSITMNSYNADWGDIFKVFFETDIGKVKFLEKYEYSSFYDNSTAAAIHYYEAKDKKLFTKTLQIRVDPITNRVLSIYIEASKSTFWSEMSENLYYVPMKEILIQQFEKPLLGSKKNVKIQYKFNQ